MNSIQIAIDKRAEGFIRVDILKQELTVDALDLSEEALGVYRINVKCSSNSSPRLQILIVDLADSLSNEESEKYPMKFRLDQNDFTGGISLAFSRPVGISYQSGFRQNSEISMENMEPYADDFVFELVDEEGFGAGKIVKSELT